jgi:hypothetical protein
MKPATPLSRMERTVLMMGLNMLHLLEKSERLRVSE